MPSLQRQVEAIIDSGIKFLDIFDFVKPNATAPFCPAGYTSINAGQADAKHECLKLKVRGTDGPLLVFGLRLSGGPSCSCGWQHPGS